MKCECDEYFKLVERHSSTQKFIKNLCSKSFSYFFILSTIDPFEYDNFFSVVEPRVMNIDKGTYVPVLWTSRRLSSIKINLKSFDFSLISF